MKAANNHLDYIDYLIDHRTWLAGATMSLADLAAAAHISVADYPGGIDWTGHDQTKGWYSGLNSRPSSRPLLAEPLEIVTPPTYYEPVEFSRPTTCEPYPSRLPLLTPGTHTTTDGCWTALSHHP